MENIYHMKSICSKIFISPFFLLIVFLSLISGLFKDVITLFMVIIIHEVGHVITSIMYKWKIKKIDITICGGFITYDEEIDKPFSEEVLIAISGFIFQGLLYLLTSVLHTYNLIDLKTLNLIDKYNLSVFLFNVLPIYPLDGSKILSVFLNMIFPYKKSVKLTNIISIITIIFIVFFFIIFDFNLEYSYIMILGFIISKIIKVIKDIPYLFNRLLFERYKKPIQTNKYTYVKTGDINKFRRRRKHYFKVNNHYYDERYILSKKFD